MSSNQPSRRSIIGCWLALLASPFMKTADAAPMVSLPVPKPEAVPGKVMSCVTIDTLVAVKTMVYDADGNCLCHIDPPGGFTTTMIYDGGKH